MQKMDEDQIKGFEIRAKMIVNALNDLPLNEKAAVICDALGYVAYYHGVSLSVASDTARMYEANFLDRIGLYSQGYRPFPFLYEEMN
jgi:hypothetical protein